MDISEAQYLTWEMPSPIGVKFATACSARASFRSPGAGPMDISEAQYLAWEMPSLIGVKFAMARPGRTRLPCCRTRSPKRPLPTTRLLAGTRRRWLAETLSGVLPRSLPSRRRAGRCQRPGQRW